MFDSSEKEDEYETKKCLPKDFFC